MSTSKYYIAATVVALLALLTTTGCIRNDIPYPRIQANLAQLEVAGQLQAASVDSINRTVTVFLDESADICNVRATGWVVTPAGAIWPDSVSFAAGIDLSKPVETTLSLYQDYVWTVSAVQTITREFQVAGQIGASTIDPIGHRVVVYLTDNANLESVLIEKLKLAGPDAVYSPNLLGVMVDFTEPVHITVTDHGRSEEWTIYVQITESTVSLTGVDAWTQVAWIHVAAQSGRQNGIQWRLAADSEWTELDPSEITTEGGALTGRLCHLQPETTYVARAYSDDEYSNEVEFTTEALYSIPNGSLDEWWLDGKVWNPWPEGGESYFDTGNKGSTTLGTSNTFPTDDTSSGTGQAACLETRFVGIGSIGKLAAGNLFAGAYVRTDGTNGILDFGRPFSLHPTKLKGYMKYKCCPVSHTSAGFEDKLGLNDTGTIWCALIDSAEPFQIRTNPKNRNLFDPDAKDVIAYGQLLYDYSIDNYVPFEVVLDYKDTSRTPRYILIVCSASLLGDYFTGGAGSTMWVDELSLDFDY